MIIDAHAEVRPALDRRRRLGAGGLCVPSAYAVAVSRSPNLRANWRKVFRDAPALCSSLMLGCAWSVTVADSVHYRAR
jgi:hypothetical protein